jgi:hypothetical protein
MSFIDLDVFDQYNKLQEDENFYDQANSLLPGTNHNLFEVLDSKKNIVELVNNIDKSSIEEISKNMGLFKGNPLGSFMVKYVFDTLKDSKQLKLFQIARNKRRYAAKKIKNFYFKNQVKLNTLSGFNKLFDDYTFCS